MNLARLNKYSFAAILFMGLAAILIMTALVTSLGEFVTAAFAISGMVCAMTGIFILTFSGGEPFDTRLVGLLPAQGCINLCQIASDLGIRGKAHFLPGHITGKTQVMQFNPTSGYTGSQVSVKGSFPKTEPEGLVTSPSGNPLIQVLIKRNALFIPKNEQNLFQLLREVLEDIFEVAPRISIVRVGNRYTLTFHRYRLIEGCREIAQQSANCCTRHPCPVCSLCGVVIAEGTDQVVTLEQCSVSASNQDVVMICSIMPPSSILAPSSSSSDPNIK